MTFIKASEVPDTPETFNCKNHGKYEARYQVFGERAFFSKCCPKCAEEKEAERAKRELLEQQRENERLRMARIEKAGVSKRNLGKTFDSFNCDNEQQSRALSHCKELCDDVINKRIAKNTFMIGRVGTGKTHLASAIVHEITDKKTVCLVRLIEMMRELKDTWRKDSTVTEQRIIDYYGSLDLLIIDEVGIQFGSDSEKMFMFDIINTRYDNIKPTVMISNLNLENIKANLGEQVVDRLREDGGKVLTFDFESQRK